MLLMESELLTETTNYQLQGNTARQATRLSGRRIRKATKPSDFIALPESFQALTVVFEMYSLA